MDENRVRLWPALAGVLLNPVETYEKLAGEERPPFLGAAFLFTGISLALALILIPKTQAYALWSLQHNPGVTPEQAAAALALTSILAVAGGVAGGLIGPWLFWVVIAGLLKLYDTLFGGKGASFGSLFAVVVYGYSPALLGLVIITLIRLAAPVANYQWVSVSLAALLPVQKTFLYFFLAQCDPFSWWSLALWGTGGALASRNKISSTLLYLLVVWLVFALIGALIAVKSAASIPG